MMLSSPPGNTDQIWFTKDMIERYTNSEWDRIVLNTLLFAPVLTPLDSDLFIRELICSNRDCVSFIDDHIDDAYWKIWNVK